MTILALYNRSKVRGVAEDVLSWRAACEHQIKHPADRTPRLESIAKILIAFITIYRYFISALLGNRCRFEPTCSCYAIEAITQYGCIKGGGLVLRRVLRCHPWCSGGIDPVPEKK